MGARLTTSMCFGRLALLSSVELPPGRTTLRVKREVDPSSLILSLVSTNIGTEKGLRWSGDQSSRPVNHLWIGTSVQPHGEQATRGRHLGKRFYQTSAGTEGPLQPERNVVFVVV